MDIILADEILTSADAATEAVLDAVVRPEGVSELARFSQRLRALSSLSTRLVVMAEREPAFEEMVKGMWRVLGCDACALYLTDHDEQRLTLRGLVGCGREDMPTTVSLDDGSSCVVHAFREEYMVQVPDTHAAGEVAPLAASLRSVLVFPIVAMQGPVGAFVFGNRVPESFAPSDIDMSGMLVDQMTYMLENLRLISQLSLSRDAVIRGMAILAEARDGDIGGHLDRICELSRLLARRLHGRGVYSVTEEFIETITRAAALHDIGKVGIPDRILLKPAKLTPEEFAVIRKHPKLGERVLADLMTTHGTFPMLEMGVDIAHGHHERWDGEGYPNRLAGEAIPLAARIVALADVYDALMSKRVYKEAWNHADVIHYLTQEAGHHFDPDLTRIFLEQDEELRRIHADHPD